MPKITRSRPNLTIDNLQEDSEYKFRFTAAPSPAAAAAAKSNKQATPSQLSLVLDVKTPAKPKERGQLDCLRLRYFMPMFCLIFFS